MSTIPLDVNETVITTAGNLYLAPPGTAFPATPATDPATPWVNVGFLEEAGPVLTGATRDVTKRFAWNVDPAIRNTYDKSEPALTFELLQWQHSTFSYYFAAPGTEYAAVVDHSDGTRRYRWEIARATIAANGDLTFVKDDFNRFPVKLDLLAAADEADPWLGLWYPDGSKSEAMNNGTTTLTPAP